MNNEEKRIEEDFENNTKSIQDIMTTITIDAVKSFPFMIRIRSVIANSSGVADDGLNWKRINDILFFDKEIHLYNAISEVKDKKDLERILSDTSMATIGLQIAWHKEACKDCGEEFFMDYGEVEFYKSKGYTMPKRCPECRKKNKARRV